MRSPVPDELPGILEDIRTPTYCRYGLDLRINFWMAPAGTTSALHWDMPGNLLAHIQGEKRFVIFPPSDGPCLYRHSIRSSTPQFSRVDIGRPDTTVFPKLSQTHPMECRLIPGDLLYLPARWWRYAEATTVTMAVNFWWLSPVTYPLVVASRLGYGSNPC